MHIVYLQRDWHNIIRGKIEGWTEAHNTNQPTSFETNKTNSFILLSFVFQAWAPFFTVTPRAALVTPTVADTRTSRTTAKIAVRDWDAHKVTFSLLYSRRHNILGLDKTAWWRLDGDLKYHPYKSVRRQELKPAQEAPILPVAAHLDWGPAAWVPGQCWGQL